METNYYHYLSGQSACSIRKMGFYHNGYVWAQQVYAENNLQIIKSWKQIRDFKKVPKVSGEGDSPNKETFHLCPRL